MRILKIINNNVVSAIDDKKNEHILMGKGIGFQKKAGDLVNLKQTEKRFSLEKQEESGGIDRLFEQIPTEYMQVASDFMAYVGNQFRISIDYGIYITVAYHIYEACKRAKQGNFIKNELLLDTMNTYPKEYALARKALTMVEEQLKVSLPRDEAGFIAIHLVNLRLHGERKEDKIREFTDRVLQIIEETGVTLDAMTPTYERFLNHLHYLGRRLFEEHGFDVSGEDEFYRQVAHKYEKAWKCTAKILDYIRDEIGIEMPDDEIMYLTIYVQRILMDKEK